MKKERKRQSVRLVRLTAAVLSVLLCGTAAGCGGGTGDGSSAVPTGTADTSAVLPPETTNTVSTEEGPTMPNTTASAATTAAGKTTAAADRTTGTTKAATAAPTAAPQRTYYDAAVGMWYTVWWDSEGQPYYEHHWVNETRSTPVRYGRYATDDTEKLRCDFSYFKRIGIDYLILDDTNDHQADGGNIASHINACFKTAAAMGRAAAPQLCIAGGSPLLNGSVERMDAELSIFAAYANRYKDTYFNWKGKPLFVDFVLPRLFGYKNDKFTVRNACGHTSEANAIAQAGKYNVKEQGLFGWVFDREFPGAEAYGVNPGWSRSHNGLQSGSPALSRENGDTYRRMWLRALKAKPETIVIASWNDHAEETGIEAVRLSETVEGREDEGKNPYLYEQMTEGYLALKTGYVDGFYYKAESDTQIYRYSGGRLQKVSSVPADGVLLWIPDDHYDWAGVKRD